MIRKIEKSDYNEFMSMIGNFYCSSAVLHPIPIENMEKTFLEVTSESPFAECFMLMHENNVAGYLLLATTYSCEVGGLVIWIDELYIKDEFRGLGIGGEAINFVKEQYSHSKRIRLEVCDSNHGAKRLYERNGFKSLDYKQMIFSR